jgi:hypothetical protein
MKKITLCFYVIFFTWHSFADTTTYCDKVKNLILEHKDFRKYAETQAAKLMHTKDPSASEGQSSEFFNIGVAFTTAEFGSALKRENTCKKTFKSLTKYINKYSEIIDEFKSSR